MNKKIFLTIGALFISLATYAQLELKQGTFERISEEEVILEGKKLNLGDQTYLFKEKVYDMDGVLCALLKLRIDKIAISDIRQLTPIVQSDIEVVRKEAKSGQLWIYLTGGKETTFSVEHPSFGKSNKVDLTLESGKIYEIHLTNGETADITFFSNPIGADIYVDDDWKGKTTERGLSVLKLPYGEHHAKAKLQGVENDRAFEITETSERSFYFNVLRKQVFHFNSEPQGATLFIDGTKIGTTPVSHELTLEFHTVKAMLDDNEDLFDKNFAEANLPNTFTLNVTEDKAVQIVATSGGQSVNADIEIDNKSFANKTPVLVRLYYGKHKVTVLYNGLSKTESINVSEKGKSHFELKLPVLKLPSKKSPRHTNITWPWERDINAEPIGISIGYTAKTWVGTGENKKTKWGFGEGSNNGEGLSGTQIGLRLNPPIRGGLGINTGLFCEFYSSRSTSFDVFDEFYTENEYGYAEMEEFGLYIPVNLEYRLQLAELFQLFINGGVGLDYGLSARLSLYSSVKEKNPSYTEDLYGKEALGGYKQFNLLAEAGCGLRINHFQINLNLGRGLLNQFSDPEYAAKPTKLMLSFSLMY